MIGCDCEVCHSTDPRDQRLRSSIYVETPECAWVVDTGTDFRTQALRENIRRLDAVVFTHSHTDHIMGFDDLRRYSHDLGSMPVYASAETMRDLERVYEFAFNGLNRFPGYLVPVPHIVDGPFQLGKTLLTPLPVPHGKSMVNGYLFSREGEKLVAYLSDCSAVPDEIVREIARRESPDHRCVAAQAASDASERESGVGSRGESAAVADFVHPYLSRPAAVQRSGTSARRRDRLRWVEVETLTGRDASPCSDPDSLAEHEQDQ